MSISSTKPFLLTGIMEMDTERGEPFLRVEKAVPVKWWSLGRLNGQILKNRYFLIQQKLVPLNELEHITRHALPDARKYDLHSDILNHLKELKKRIGYPFRTVLIHQEVIGRISSARATSR